MRPLTYAMAGLVLVLTGCAGAEPGTETPGTQAPDTTETSGAVEQAPGGTEAQELLARYGLDGLPVEAVIDELDRLGGADRPTDLMASVRSEALLLSDGVAEHSLPLPADRFYVSVAPYVNQTHECFFHSLTTCRGELGGEVVTVRVVDDAGGVLVDEERTTFANGFVGIWLPRDVTGTIEITQSGRTGVVDFSTGADGATCVTTLRLT